MNLRNLYLSISTMQIAYRKSRTYAALCSIAQSPIVKLITDGIVLLFQTIVILCATFVITYLTYLVSYYWYHLNWYILITIDYVPVSLIDQDFLPIGMMLVELAVIILITVCLLVCYDNCVKTYNKFRVDMIRYDLESVEWQK
jgi:hypothetical protein